MKRPVLILIGLLAGACNAAPPVSDAPPPDWLVGKYHYEGNGRVARKFPWDAKADLLLDKDGQYTMSITVHIDDNKGGDTDTNESYGSYSLVGDRIQLEPANGNDDDDDSPHELELHGTRLIPKLPWAARVALKGFRIPNPEFVKIQ